MSFQSYFVHQRFSWCLTFTVTLKDFSVPRTAWIGDGNVILTQMRSWKRICARSSSLVILEMQSLGNRYAQPSSLEGGCEAESPTNSNKRVKCKGAAVSK